MKPFCKADVWSRTGFYKCDRAPKRDGFCAQHHPDAKKKRHAKREARWKQEDAERDSLHAVEDAERDVIAAAVRLHLKTSSTAGIIGAGESDMRPLRVAVEGLRSAEAKRKTVLAAGKIRL